MQTYDKDESGQIEFNEFLLMFRNSLLDLKAMRQYMADDYTGPMDSTGNVIDVSMTNTRTSICACGTWRCAVVRRLALLNGMPSNPLHPKANVKRRHLFVLLEGKSGPSPMLPLKCQEGRLQHTSMEIWFPPYARNVAHVVASWFSGLHVCSYRMRAPSRL